MVSREQVLRMATQSRGHGTHRLRLDGLVGWVKQGCATHQWNSPHKYQLSPPMLPPAEEAHKAGLSDFLAAERTLLAWIRTGLALMGLGFVVARFGLFLQALQVTQHSFPARSEGLSPWFGTALMAVGVIVNIGAGWRHVRLVRQLQRGETTRPVAANLAAGVAFFLALVGLAMAIY